MSDASANLDVSGDPLRQPSSDPEGQSTGQVPGETTAIHSSSPGGSEMVYHLQRQPCQVAITPS